MTEDKFAEKSTNWDNPIKVKMAENFVSEIFKNHKFGTNDKIFEFGCGTGLVGLSIAPHVLSATMLDNSPAMIDILKGKIELGDYHNIKIILGELDSDKDADYDCFITFMALHHVDDMQKLLNIVYRKLKIGGSVIIGDLTTEDGSFHGGETVPHNGFDLAELSEILQKSGLTVSYSSLYDKVTKNNHIYDLFFIKAEKM